MDRRAFMAGSAASLAMPSLGNADSSRVLKFIPQADLPSLDPVWSINLPVHHHGYLVFDTLYGQAGPESGLAISPQMVQGHRVESDGRTWTLTLRDGLRFHDGHPVLARDCVASIHRWGARDALGQTLMQRTDAVLALDDRTVTFRLNRPFPMLPYALGKSSGITCVIMPERLAATDPFKPVTEVVGSGPFRFRADERVPGAFVSYERFADYLPCSDGTTEATAGPKIAHFDRVEWHIIPDPSTAAAALLAGEVDWWESVAPDSVPTIKRNGKVQTKVLASGCYGGVLRPNHLVPPSTRPACVAP